MSKRSLQSLASRISFARKHRTTFNAVGTELPHGAPIEEETVPGYEARSYFPVEPGHFFNQRYEALAKLGWGSCSTVWLVRDLRR